MLGLGVGWLPLTGLFTSLALLGVVGVAANRERRRVADSVAKIDDDDEAETLTPPDVHSSFFGIISAWRHRAKARKLAKRGYVRWYKLDAQMAAPTWIKPESRGAGEWEHYDSEDEIHYLFPKSSMATDARTGAFVAIHRRGEAEPINLNDPAFPPLDGDRLREVIDLEAESDAPGFFDRLDIDGETIMWVGIATMLALGAVNQFLM